MLHPTLTKALVDAHSAELRRPSKSRCSPAARKITSRDRSRKAPVIGTRRALSLLVASGLLLGTLAVPVVASAAPAGPQNTTTAQGAPQRTLDAAPIVAGNKVALDSTSAAPSFGAPSVTGPPGFCHGVNATIIGGSGNDPILGTPGDDVIDAGGGNDVVYPSAGNDLICGGAGDDILYGGAGDDQLSGQAGNDGLRGGDGNDILAGHAGSDRHLGEAGNDRLDTVWADDASIDTVFGGPGNDRIKTLDGIANDSGAVGPGFDLCFMDQGDHVLDCDGGYLPEP